MSRLARDGTAEPVSRDQILRHARGQGNIIFPVQLTTSRIGNLTRLIHALLYVMTIHIGRDLMIPLYILSAQTRNQKITTHATYYFIIIPLPFLQARELKNNFPISFQLRVSFFFSFFFKDPMYCCTGFINYHSSMFLR